MKSVESGDVETVLESVEVSPKGCKDRDGFRRHDGDEQGREGIKIGEGDEIGAR